MNVKRIILKSFFLVFLLVARPSYAFFSDWIAPLTLGGLIGAAIAVAFTDKPCSETPTPTPIPPPLTTSNVFFVEPGVKNLIITNSGDNEVFVSGIDFTDVYGVSVGDISGCQPIAANGGCVVELTAAIDAYGGNGVANIYNTLQTTTAIVIVANSTLSLYRYKNGSWESTAIPTSEDITVEREASSQYFRYVNEGNFLWQEKAVTIPWNYINWDDPFDPLVSSVTLAEESYDPGKPPTFGSKCNNASIGVGEFCVFSFTNVSGGDHPGETAVLNITGENIGTNTNGLIRKNVLGSGGLEIVENMAVGDQHVEYRSLKVKNTVKIGSPATPRDVTLNDFDVTIPGTKLEHCDSFSDCFYKTECSSSTVLSSGNNYQCLVWFRAKDIGVLGEEEIGNIEVVAKGRYNDGSKDVDIEEIDTFDFTHNLDFYAGFYFFGGSFDGGGVSKYNGTSWSEVWQKQAAASPLDISLEMGDLYVGGSFVNLVEVSASNNIVRWNGSNWSTLGGGVNDFIYDITSINGDLYVGGKFTDVGSRVAKWDGSNWSALGGGVGGDVYALAILNGDLYVGGSFTDVGNRVAKWDIGSSSWSNLPNDVDNGVTSDVYVLTAMSGDLYVGGIFSNAGTTIVNNVAKWDGSSWFVLAGGVNGNVRALAANTMSGDLYVGGRFNDVGSRIARWDVGGSSWSILSSGIDDGEVYDIAIAGNGDVYVGGSFSGAGGVSATNYVARYSALNGWESLLGTGSGYPGGSPGSGLVVTDAVAIVPSISNIVHTLSPYGP